MPNDTTPAGDGPRSPADQDTTGTGTPRSADDGPAQPGARGEATNVDPAVVGGRLSTSQPAGADDVTANRSGSGGSGGPATPDDSVEGSTGQSMDELLTGTDEADDRPR